MMKKNRKKELLNKTRSVKSINDINREAQKIIDWNKKGIGLSASLQRSLKQLKLDTEEKAAEKFIQSFEEEQLLQEMYEWYNKIKDIHSDEKPLNEIKNIVEAFFDRLQERYNISIIEEPDSIIKSPARGSRYYRFENKYSHSLKYARVLRCGLKIKNKVISPCVLVQTKDI